MKNIFNFTFSDLDKYIKLILYDMILQDLIISPADTPDNFYTRKLKMRVEERCSIYINNCIQIQDNRSSSSIQKETYLFRKSLTKFNEEYREFVLGLNPKSKVPAITVGSYIISLNQMIEKQYHHVVTPDNKILYENNVFYNILIDELVLIYSKYKKIYDFQLVAAACYIISDFFIPESIPFNNVKRMIERVIGVDCVVIQNLIKQFNIEEPANKMKKQKNNAFPDKETIESWLAAGYKRTYIKRTLARQMGCSEKTIQRLLSSYDLTDKKYITKINLSK